MDVVNTVLEGARKLVEEILLQLPQVGIAILVLLLTWLIATAAGRIARGIFSRSKLRESLVLLFTRLVRVGIWMGGIVTAALIAIPGLSATGFIAALGLITIAVGFAFKDIFENLLAGILLMVREPFKLGDYVECEDIDGQIESIHIRDTSVRQGDGQLVVVPNRIFYQNPVTVRTDLPLRRVSITCGVAYSEDVDRCREIIRKAVEQVEAVSTEKPIDVLASEFGASSVDYEVRWWAKSTPAGVATSIDAVIPAIKKALDEADVEIPFPYRTLTFSEPLEVKGDGLESS